jgi:hypothetical protein
MFWDVLIAFGIGLMQLAVTAYAVDISVRDNRIKNAVIIGIAGFIGIGLTVAGTIRNAQTQETAATQQTELQHKIEAVQKKLDESQRASVGLYDIFVWPKQELVANTKVPVQIRYFVKEGVAKNYRVWEELFTMDGKPSSELDRRAIDKFRRDSVGKFDYKGEDKVQGTGTQRTLYINLSRKELKQVFAETRLIYIFARIEWNNPAGADFHTEVCSWMEHPTDKVIDHLGWHECHP